MNIALTPPTENRLEVVYVPERVSTEALLAVLHAKVARRTGTRRGGPRLSLVQRVQVYDLGTDWTDRLIVGDSRIVMDSFLECTRLAGKVEMLYVDPPASETSDDDPADVYDAAIAAARDVWRNRWRGLHDWFVSADSISLSSLERSPSDSKSESAISSTRETGICTPACSSTNAIESATLGECIQATINSASSFRRTHLSSEV